MKWHLPLLFVCLTASSAHLRGEAPKARPPLKGHTDYVQALAFNGNLLASGSDDRTVRLWDVASGRHRATVMAPGKVPLVRAVAVSGDGKWLALSWTTGSVTNTDFAVRLWELAGPKP